MARDDFKIHPEVKKILIRKHIAAVSTGITSTIISLIIAIVLYELNTNGKPVSKLVETLVDAIDAIITVLLFASCAFLLFNKRGYETEIANTKRVMIPTIIVFCDFTVSFVVSVVMAFGKLNTDQLIMWFMISFGISIVMLLISEFVLFHVGSHTEKVYGDDKTSSVA